MNRCLIQVDRFRQEVGIPGFTYQPGDPESEAAARAAFAQLDPASDEQEAALDHIEALRDKLDQQREQDCATYGEAFKANVLAELTDDGSDHRQPMALSAKGYSPSADPLPSLLRVTVDQRQNLRDRIDCGLAHHISGDAELFCLTPELGGHLLDGADERERCEAKIIHWHTLQPLAQVSKRVGSVVGDRHDLDECLDLGRCATALAFLVNDVELGIKVRAGPSHLMPVPVGAGATQTAQSNDVGSCRGDPQHLRVPAADHEPDPPGDGKVFQKSIDQTHISSVGGDGFTVEQTRDGINEFREATRAVRR